MSWRDDLLLTDQGQEETFFGIRVYTSPVIPRGRLVFAADPGAIDSPATGIWAHDRDELLWQIWLGLQRIEAKRFLKKLIERFEAEVQGPSGSAPSSSQDRPSASRSARPGPGEWLGPSGEKGGLGLGDPVSALKAKGLKW